MITQDDYGNGGRASVLSHPRRECLLAECECAALSRAHAAQLDGELVAQQAAEGLAERRALGVPGVMRPQPGPQRLPVDLLPAAGRPPRADSHVQQDQPVMLETSAGIDPRRQGPEPPAVHPAGGRDRRRPRQDLRPRVQARRIDEPSDLNGAGVHTGSI